MNYAKTALLLVLMAAILIWAGGLIGGANGALIAFVVALVINGISYWYSDKIVLKMYNAQEVERSKSPRLYEMVDGLCQNAGIPSPRIFMTAAEAPNAFATGRNPQNAALCLTKGIVKLLDEEELKGVISHELAHVRNRDTLTMTVTAALASAVMMIAYMARWAAIFGGFSRDRRDSGNIISLLALSILAPLAALLVQLAISRSREYEADSTGAGIAGDPTGLARALEELAQASQRYRLDAPPQTTHLLIVQPSKKGNFLANLFSTHPPIDERVKRLKGMA